MRFLPFAKDANSVVKLATRAGAGSITLDVIIKLAGHTSLYYSFEIAVLKRFLPFQAHTH